MNAFFAVQTRPNAPSANVNVAPLQVRHIHRERDFGVGYGNSSGYASNRHYAHDWMQPRFRCA
jgi:hypothetical protein